VRWLACGWLGGDETGALCEVHPAHVIANNKAQDTRPMQPAGFRLAVS
jgi:hypothetical protein